MKSHKPYKQKFTTISSQTIFPLLTEDEQHFIRTQAETMRFTLQELRQVCEITRDLNMWEGATIQQIWPALETKKHLIKELKSHWADLKNNAIQYPDTQDSSNLPTQKLKLATIAKERLGLGYCPVASPRTRCCNLMTLDAIDNCGFDCSYCSIQAFYHENKIFFDQGFADKLQALELDPNETYHIGTGQSSDSLMWGNKHGILDALCQFAHANPNVILELKTKSKNINYLLEHEIPPNIICTWSLSTPTLISNEEHRTATLEDRLDAARQVANQGILVGFHFHPMIHYSHWQEDYSAIFSSLQTMFSPPEVALVSLGTLTFTKGVIKQIRQRGLKSKILQLPLVETSGKLSYPDEMKLEMFSHVYNSLSTWHDEVFFYLCMENNRLWQPVFGYEYPTNEDFEIAMKRHYMGKVRGIDPTITNR
ncbi:Spore photoproduct lyase [hydrothermal vent metagenome]|uniref:Spore photoproduct lyase n=1 Tax=hydrothermal vent metagenome TaxID=652676 RepID=A0A3B1BDQ4_9ZZZZ